MTADEITKNKTIGKQTMGRKVTVARHEAGHVVAYHHFGREFQSVSIIPKETNKETHLGRCIPFPQDHLQNSTEIALTEKTLLTEWMIVACAGVAAEMLWLPKDRPVKDWMNQSDVLPLWRCYSDRYGINASLPWAGGCWLEAERLMQQHHKAVERLAEALLDQPIMSGAEAVGIVRSAKTSSDRISSNKISCS